MQQRYVNAYFAKDRDAAFAMTVFARLLMAARMSTSSWFVGAVKAL